MTKDRNIFWRQKESRWRVQIKCRGCWYEKHFSVKRYGSQLQALLAARAWRDQLLSSLPRRKIKCKSNRNRSGKIGVFLHCKTNPSGKQYWSWKASWRENGRNRIRKFSILKYGEEKARALAIRAREQAIHEPLMLLTTA